MKKTRAKAPPRLKPLPCPFCGEPGQPKRYGTVRHAIMCVSDVCPIQPGTADASTKAEALLLWNTRASGSGTAKERG